MATRQQETNGVLCTLFLHLSEVEKETLGWRRLRSGSESMEEDDLVLVACAAVGHAVAFIAGDRAPFPRRSPSQFLTVTSLPFDTMLQSAAYASWFEDNMRCTKETFLRLGRFLQEHGIRFANAKVRQHSYEKKVAAALYFLGSSGGYREVDAAMGMSRSYVKEITDEVIHVLKLVACQVISFPRDRRRWNTIEDQFALRQGYPGVAGAIDGSLVEVERPDDFDGFYCRKSYPALNVQAIVTMDNYFLSVEVRPGSWSDRKCWQHSVIARNVFNIIPAGTHFVSDAGYALSPGLMVPYSDREEGGALTERQNKFNYFHSSTRMAVESTFGHWKGILQCTLNQDTPRDASDVIVATTVLHNLIISFRDAAAIPRYVEEDDDELIFDDTTCLSRQRDVAVAKRNAIANLLWP